MSGTSSWADAAADEDNAASSAAIPVPDLRGNDSAFTLSMRNWVLVPIPIYNPTLDTGLVIGGAYFYPQTEQQKKSQPPSVTGAAGFYSSNKSSAFGIAHQSYLREHKWCISAIAGHSEIRFDLSVPDFRGSASVDWFVKGEFFAASVAREIGGDWYAGIIARYVDMRQRFRFDKTSTEFSTEPDAISAGLGINMEFDNRDRPINSQEGSHLKFSVLTNSKGLGSDDGYESYKVNYSSYHSLGRALKLAWELQGCRKPDRAPLRDAC